MHEINPNKKHRCLKVIINRKHSYHHINDGIVGGVVRMQINVLAHIFVRE